MFYNVNSDSSAPPPQTFLSVRRNVYEYLLIHLVLLAAFLACLWHDFISTKTNRNCLFFPPQYLFSLLVSADIARFRTLQPATNLDGRAAADVCREQ